MKSNEQVLLPTFGHQKYRIANKRNTIQQSTQYYSTQKCNWFSKHVLGLKCMIAVITFQLCFNDLIFDVTSRRCCYAFSISICDSTSRSLQKKSKWRRSYSSNNCAPTSTSTCLFVQKSFADEFSSLYNRNSTSHVGTRSQKRGTVAETTTKRRRNTENRAKNDHSGDRFNRQSSTTSAGRDDKDEFSSSSGSSTVYGPIPVMPSQLFQQLALSQLELLANAVVFRNTADGTEVTSKIKSMALYLPQENSITGQLEFTPAVLYPNPASERVFIASDALSGVAPTLPKTLSKLPGFAHATMLLPSYPMVYSSSSQSSNVYDEIPSGVGIVEEVMCDVRMGGTALSIPLFRGAQTVGVLLVSPATTSSTNRQSSLFWADDDKNMVERAARSLSLALSMDAERARLEVQKDEAYRSLSDSLHQFKNPLQALRTFCKVLQQRIADTTDDSAIPYASTTPSLLELTNHLMVQSDRLVERLKPMDSIVDSLSDDHKSLLLPWTPVTPSQLTSSIPFLLAPSESVKSSLVSSALVRSVLSNEQISRNDFGEGPTGSNEEVQHRRRNGSGTTKSKSQHESRRMNLILNVTEVSHSSDTRSIEESVSRRAKDESTFDNNANAVTGMMSPSNGNVLLSSDLKRSGLEEGSKGSGIISTMDIRMTFVVDVLQPILSGFYAIAEAENISFVVEGDTDDNLPGVMACEEGLQEAFTNILDNAFRYVVVSKTNQLQDSTSLSSENDNSNNIISIDSATGSATGNTFIKNTNPKVRVRFVSNSNVRKSQERKRTTTSSPTPIHNGGVTIYIEDNGPGIPQNERADIFARGVRGKSIQNVVTGSGLGLSIAQNLIQSMGGTIDIIDNNTNGNTNKNYSNDEYDGTVIRIMLFRNYRE